MRASVVMAIAVLLYIITRWSRNEPAVTLPGVVGGAFAILVIALLDQGRTEEIARGFAWLFFIVAFMNAIGPIATAATTTAKSGGTSVKKTLA
jgi:hypothetical protein